MGASPSSAGFSSASGPAAAGAASGAAAAAAARSSAFDGCTKVPGNQGSSPQATGPSPSSARHSLIVLRPDLTWISKTFVLPRVSASTGSSNAKNSRGSTRRAITESAEAIAVHRGRIAFFWCW